MIPRSTPQARLGGAAGLLFALSAASPSCGCARAGSRSRSPEPAVTATRDTRRAVHVDAAEFATMRSLDALDAWSFPPRPPVVEGRVRHVVRYETIHVTVDLPPGVNPTKERLATGHPVVYVRMPGFVADITFGAPAHFMITGDMPASIGHPRREADAGNVTAAFHRLGERVVFGHAPGASCAVAHFDPAREDDAFGVCRSMRVAPVGPLEPPPIEHPDWPPIPRGAEVSVAGSVTTVHAGAFHLRLRSGACRRPSDADLQASGSTLEDAATERGPYSVERTQARILDERWPSEVFVRAQRGHLCCVGGTHEFTPPTDAQIAYLVGVCDLAGP